MQNAVGMLRTCLLLHCLDMLGNKQPQISVAKKHTNAVYYSCYQMCTSGGWDSDISYSGTRLMEDSS